MNSEITIDLNDFDHIAEKSRYNRNYYRIKADKITWCVNLEILIVTDEDNNTNRFYVVDGDKELFLFCDYSYSDNKTDHDVYTGTLFHWWT